MDKQKIGKEIINTPNGDIEIDKGQYIGIGDSVRIYLQGKCDTCKINNNRLCLFKGDFDYLIVEELK